MIRSRFYKFIEYLFLFIRLHLFLTIVALPIFVVWGLPVAILSPLGNLIFTPFLGLFLFISSCIFIADLCYIPSTWFVYLLNICTDWWLWLLKKPIPLWCLKTLSIHSLPIVVCGVVAAFFVLRTKYISRIRYHVFWLAVILAIISVHGYNYKISDCNFKIENGSKKTTVIVKNQHVFIVDNEGSFSKSAQSAAWVSFNLVPEIVRNAGSLSIDWIMITNINSYSLAALESLCEITHVNCIYLAWRDVLSPATLLKYETFKQSMQSKGIIIKRFGARTMYSIKKYDKNLLHELFGIMNKN